jgi:hypothetical protein
VTARNRALALLAVTGDATAAYGAQAFAEEAERACRGVGSSDAHWRVLCRCPPPDDPNSSYSQILERGLANGVHLGGFDVVVEVSTPAGQPLDSLVPCFAGLADRVRAYAVVGKSRIVVGRDLVIVDGDGDIQLVYAMRRSPGTTHDEFSRFWAEQHTKVAVSTPGLLGYRQLHVEPQLSAQAARLAGLPAGEIDGIALEWFATFDDFAGAVGGPAQFRTRAKQSEVQFNDLDGVSAILASTVASSRERSGAAW